jgi:6-phosphofructokinase 2
MKRILTITLNPALDLTTTVPALVSDRKMRCTPPRIEPGGGGVNVSRAISKLGRSSIPFVAIGGGVGDELRSRLQAEGIDGIWFDTGAPTRQSFAVHDATAAVQYRFVLPGSPWSSQTWQSGLETLTSLLQPDDLIVISGSLPPGVPKHAHRTIAELARYDGQHIIVDTSGEPLATLAGGSPSRVDTIVMDETEALSLIQEERMEVSSTIKLAREIVERRNARFVIVTLGARGAVAIKDDEAWRVTPPPVEVASKVGAGDSFVAGLAIGLAEGQPVANAITLAMGAAASAVTTPASQLCTREGAEKYTRHVRVRQI